MQNKRGNVAVIAIIVVIVAITVGVIGWMFLKNNKTLTQQVATNQPATATRETKSKEVETPKQVQESNTEASSTWDRYKETTLEQIMLEEKGSLADNASGKSETYVFNAKSLNNPYSVNLVYKNKYRKILPQTAQFLKTWGKSLGVDTKNVALYEEEVLFAEPNDNEHWMPIQKQLVPYLKKEAVSDGHVDLAIMWPGAYLESTGYNWVFLINEFNAQ